MLSISFNQVQNFVWYQYIYWEIERIWGSSCFQYETWLSDNCITNAKPTEFTKSNKQEITTMHIAVTFKPKYLGATVWTWLTGQGKVKPQCGGGSNGGLQATGLAAWHAVVCSVSRWCACGGCGWWSTGPAATVDDHPQDLHHHLWVSSP